MILRLVLKLSLMLKLKLLDVNMIFIPLIILEDNLLVDVYKRRLSELSFPRGNLLLSSRRFASVRRSIGATCR